MYEGTDQFTLECIRKEADNIDMNNARTRWHFMCDEVGSYVQRRN